MNSKMFDAKIECVYLEQDLCRAQTHFCSLARSLLLSAFCSFHSALHRFDGKYGKLNVKTTPWNSFHFIYVSNVNGGKSIFIFYVVVSMCPKPNVYRYVVAAVATAAATTP